MSDNKGKKIETKSEQPMKHAEPRDTALLSDILPLPEPRFHGRIGNTYVDSEADYRFIADGASGCPQRTGDPA
jgi:hypothetical protein